MTVLAVSAVPFAAPIKEPPPREKGTVRELNTEVGLELPESPELFSSMSDEENCEWAAGAEESAPDYRNIDGIPEEEEQDKKFIKWASFDIPADALRRAMDFDIKLNRQGKSFSWIELLALQACKLYGNWSNHSAKGLNAIAKKMQEGEAFADYKSGKTYAYFYEVYDTVLSQYLGWHTVEAADLSDSKKVVHKTVYGLKAFSPIAYGYSVSECDDFGNARNFGYKRRHLGHDMMGSIGTPIVAVEGGVIEELGWNRYGGWRIGIRSFDKKRYYYYAHLRKDRPFVKSLKKGDTVLAGDVVGYLGMTGYSSKENVNNIKTPHLHFGLQLIFDESQKDGRGEIWVDVYRLVQLLRRNRSKIVYDSEADDFKRKYNFVF